MGMYGDYCMICCVLISPLGIIFLSIMAILLYQESQSIEIKDSLKHSRGLSSIIAAAMYLAIFIFCIILILKARRKPTTTTFSVAMDTASTEDLNAAKNTTNLTMG